MLSNMLLTSNECTCVHTPAVVGSQLQRARLACNWRITGNYILVSIVSEKVLFLKNLNALECAKTQYKVNNGASFFVSKYGGYEWGTICMHSISFWNLSSLEN